MVEIIKKLCKKNHITLAALQDEMGFSKNAINGWDKNNPSIDKVAKVAEYFGVSIDYLYGIADDPKPNKMIIDINQLKLMSDDELRELAFRALEEIERRQGK